MHRSICSMCFTIVIAMTAGVLLLADMGSAMPPYDMGGQVPSYSQTQRDITMADGQHSSSAERDYCEEICASLSDENTSAWRRCALCAARIAGVANTFDLVKTF